MKSFVIQAFTGLICTLLGHRVTDQVYAPTGVAAFQVGGETSRRLLRRAIGIKAYAQLEPPKGESARLFHGELSARASLIGDVRGMIGRSMLGWQEYRASLAPFRGAAEVRDP